jgi:general stress protein 26
MGDRTLQQLARKLRALDFAMLMTYAPGGQISGRPMSNNREVEYRGDSYYFTLNLAQMVRDIERNPHVGLVFQTRGPFGGAGLQINVQGIGRVIRDKQRYRQHWHKGADLWFRQGADTPGLVMIHVQARRVNYWDGKNQEEIIVGT